MGVLDSSVKLQGRTAIMDWSKNDLDYCKHDHQITLWAGEALRSFALQSCWAPAAPINAGLNFRCLALLGLIFPYLYSRVLFLWQFISGTRRISSDPLRVSEVLLFWMLQCCQFCLLTDRHQLTLTPLLLSLCLNLSELLPSAAFCHCLLGSAVHLTVASLPLVSRIGLSRVKGCLQIPFNLPATDGSCQSPSSYYTNDCSSWGLWVLGGWLFACFGTTNIHLPSDSEPLAIPLKQDGHRAGSNVSRDLTGPPKGAVENRQHFELLDPGCCCLEVQRYNRARAMQKVRKKHRENRSYFNHLIWA